jgi:hypothetical protein
MKKRIRIFQLTIIGIFLLLNTSCTKGGDSTNQPLASQKKIKTIIYSNSTSQSKIYDYNSEGKLIKASSIDGTYISDYTYAGNIITEVMHYAGKTYTTVYTMNSQGYVTNINGSDEHDRFVETFEYDNLGNCVKRISTFVIYGVSTFSYTYLDGNMTSQSEFQTIYNSTETYEFYLDKENTLGWGSPEPWNLTGKPNKNLVKKINFGFASYNCTYEFDQNNLITKQIQTPTDGHAAEWITYSYQ